MTASAFPSSRSRRIASVASTLIVITLAAALLALVVGASLREAWWPRTGQAFAAGAHFGSARQDPCDLIVGPAKTYCARGHHHSPTASTHEATRKDATAAWMLIPPAAGLAALVVWRRRGTAGQGRP